MKFTNVSPLYSMTVGFDRLFDLLAQAERAETAASWPPYDIERSGDDRYRITMAVAGFSADEIELIQHDAQLVVTGQRKDAEDRQFLHRGIAGRSFRQSFNLADHVRVTGASLENGLLTVDLVREVPEALKPRRIAIGGSTAMSGQDNAPTAQIERHPRAA